MKERTQCTIPQRIRCNEQLLSQPAKGPLGEYSQEHEIYPSISIASKKVTIFKSSRSKLNDQKAYYTLTHVTTCT